MNKKIINILNRILGLTKVKVKGKNNSIKNNGILHKCNVEIIGENNNIIIKKDVRLLNYKIFIKGDYNNLEIGEGCVMRNGAFWFEDESNTIKIGRNTTSEGANIFVMENGKNIFIGDDCMLSFDIDIRNSDAHSIIDIKTEKRINYATDITIGNHVWIGAHVQILKNTIIEDNCVIGTRSLVNKHITANSLGVGLPVEIKKSNINWLRERT